MGSLPPSIIWLNINAFASLRSVITHKDVGSLFRTSSDHPLSTTTFIIRTFGFPHNSEASYPNRNVIGCACEQTLYGSVSDEDGAVVDWLSRNITS